jgi:hypothetical protein
MVFDDLNCMAPIRRSFACIGDNFKTSEWSEPRACEILLHCRRSLFVTGVDDDDAFEALLREKSCNFLPGSPEDGVIGMHPMQIVVEKDDLEVIVVQCLESRLCVLGEDRIGQPLSKP